MHRELKLQHALLQQIAHRIGVSEEATEEVRKLVEEAPEGAPVAALLRTPPITKENGGPQLVVATSQADKRSSSESNPGQDQSAAKSEV